MNPAEGPGSPLTGSSFSCSAPPPPQWLPESARYDVLSGNQEKAMATLKRIAMDNGAPMPLGKLIVSRQVGLKRAAGSASPSQHNHPSATNGAPSEEIPPPR